MTDHIAKVSTVIKAPASKVWEALTKPELVKKYFFGTDVITDWKVGSPIIYRGVWEGKPYEEKGNVLKNEPEKLLLTNYWSPSRGVTDSPENYQNVEYKLEPAEEGTKVTITQDGNKDEESKNHSETNWGMILDGMKKLLEV